MASLPLPGAGAGDHHDGLGRLDVLVGAVALVADDGVDLGGVALGEAVGVDPDAAALQLVLEDLGGELVGEAGDDHGAQGDAPGGQVVDQLQGVGVVGDAEVGAHFFALDVAGIDAEDDVGLVLQLLQQAHLDVGVEAGQDAGGVVVVEQLAAELQVELVVEAHGPARGWPRSARCRYFSLSKPVGLGHGGSPGEGIVRGAGYLSSWMAWEKTLTIFSKSSNLSKYRLMPFFVGAHSPDSAWYQLRTLKYFLPLKVESEKMSFWVAFSLHEADVQRIVVFLDEIGLLDVHLLLDRFF